ncbi:lipooligosaccharide transport system permease protein [Haloechinothrix alba]|uniref:Transport permease protein n=1 Tax=Haloechinothrix alba TaxID=664784 RepID=A0A238XJQ6_9PSEU|nr:ABC transporter permease [Haloechinothrix alba]SNR59147.1 lipooligosaccharide transport system permease protein [Haloechinothrix alba]
MAANTEVTGTARSRSVTLRILPPGLYAGRASKVLERSLLVSRKMWLVFVSGIVEPAVYLLAFQIGFGRLVTEVVGPGGEVMSYAAFVASALMVASAMNGAVYDATFNVFFKIRHARTYEGMLATPVGPVDIAMGEVSWSMLRGGLYAVAFLAIMTLLGLSGSPWVVLLVPVALLVAFTFAALGMACVTFIRTVSQFDYIQLAVMPLFLFSATFYPLSVYPEPLRPVVQLSPLYHGVELARQLSVGVVDPALLGHVGYLAALAALGLWVTSRRLAGLLLR